MSSEIPPGLQRELLDDFFSECDEHLAHIREGLVLLEPSIGKVQADHAVVEDLFRNFHSFKGISAIVGLRPAEELAHASEDFLRELMRGSLSLSTDSLELLMQATQRLEQIAGAFRAGRTLPGAGALLEELHKFSGRSDAKATSVPDSTSIPAPQSSDPAFKEEQAGSAVLWKITFTPSKELDQRGINITSVRARLVERGEIIKATPQVRAGGTLTFDFVVAMKEAPADIALWEADGLSAELLESSREPEQSSPLEEHNPFIAPSHIVRVDLPRLDELMRVVGEMVIKRSRLEDELHRLARKGEVLDLEALREINSGFGRSLRELREGIMRVRMVPVAEIFARMPFVVRDLARDSQKKARLVLAGQNTEIDKYLIEQLKDPLLHLVRNSFSHGVEPPQKRTELRKSEEATITLTAATSGDSVVITVSDDGSGVDRRAVLRRSREMNIASADTLDKLDDTALLEVLCTPGFSTRTDADLAAGRGVGMAVVQKTVRELGGTLALETRESLGTTFTIRVPLTLAIAETLIVSAADQTCAVPQSYVAEVLAVEESAIQRVNGVEVMQYREGVLPLVRLSAFFRLTRPARSSLCVLVLRSDRGSSGLVVERIHGQREVVVRPIRDPLIQAPGVAGATELGDGRPVLILDGAAFTSGAVRPNSGANAMN